MACPEGTVPIYDGYSGIIIDCNANLASSPFANSEHFQNIQGGPSSTPLDYINYGSGQEDAYKDAAAIYQEKLEAFKSSIPTAWNYALVFFLILLVCVILFVLFKKKASQPS